jgi:hypothetical protein
MRRSLIGAVFVAIVALWFTPPVGGQTPADSAAAGAKQRLAFMVSVIEDYKFSSDDIESKSAGQFVRQPLLRYSDPTRDLMDTSASALIDAGVWRLGKEGRPTALVVLEIYRSADGKGTLAHEFVSLSPQRFSVSQQDKSVQWQATGTDLKLVALDRAPTPAKSAAGRLTQMRQLARRFTAKETLGENFIACRLMSQPIDRYQSEAEGIIDGAIFAYANGTNPELAVILEADKSGWKYGVVRLGAAKSSMLLDDRQVASFPFFGDYGRREGTYTSTSHAVELPQ